MTQDIIVTLIGLFLVTALTNIFATREGYINKRFNMIKYVVEDKEK